MRYFFALWPDSAARTRLEGLAAVTQCELGGRMTRPENLHLTLAFLGGLANAELDAVESVADSIRMESFELSIDRIGYWPHNRLAWTGPSAVPAALHSIVCDLRNGSIERKRLQSTRKRSCRT